MTLMRSTSPSGKVSSAPAPSITGESPTKAIALYLLLAFGISWLLLVGAIKLGLGEEYLNIGVAGPAIAALILSARNHKNENPFSRAQLLCFSCTWVLCWFVICLHYLWRNADTLQVRLNPWLLIPASIPAWILSSAFSGNQGIRTLVRRIVHTPDRWSLFALAFIPVMLGFPTLVAYALHAKLVSPEVRSSPFANFADGFVFFLFNLLFVAVEEEPGWRGFLLDRLQRKFSPLVSSLFVWLPWAAWHAPLDYYRPVRFDWVTYVLLRVVFLIPLTVVLTWLYNRSNRSIQSTAIFHASMNTAPFVMPYYQPAWILLFVFTGYAIISSKMWKIRQQSSLPQDSQPETID
jgi:uncharacterized protein